MLDVVAVIPCRMAAQRLPGKPLLARTGKPLVRHVYERVAGARGLFDRVVIATCDDEIERAARAFGAPVERTRDDHRTGTDRVAEAAARIPARFYVNVQGDEPQMSEAVLRALVAAIREGGAPLATVASPWPEGFDPASPSEVKVVVDGRGRALYFSRSVVPWGASGGRGLLRHVGVYAYEAGFLPRFAAMPRTPLEEAESLEQLRALENGVPVAVAVVPYAGRSIDTPRDYEEFVRREARGGTGAAGG